MNTTTQVALFNQSVGQITQYISIAEALNFPSEGIGYIWYQDRAGNTYSTFALMSIIN